MNENTLEDKYALIKQEVLKCKSDNPIEIAQKIMRKNFVNIHGPEHHFLDGAAFLAAFKNAGGAIELDLCLTELYQPHNKNARRYVRLLGRLRFGNFNRRGIFNI